jgi:Asp-tRNA(Asn)/Glu-tRNA(Gln) amidotransferase A subunit family amidase
MHPRSQCVHSLLLAAIVSSVPAAAGAGPASGQGGHPAARPPAKPFHVEEATIDQIELAIKTRQLTVVDLVHLYLDRIKEYNGTCVNQPEGILGRITPIRDAGRIDALITLNLRPGTRKALGFDDREARSMTDSSDNDTKMPDALEVAAQLDRRFAQTGQLAGPLHGIVFAIKDQYDTFDMRTTSGADAFYANDRPPRDSAVVERLRAAGAVILAKANMGEYAGGDRSSFGGTGCNPYDTTRGPSGSSGGSAASVAANFVTCAIAEESGPSIRMPSQSNNVVGLSPSLGLVSRHGMMGGSLNDRVGPVCRTVKDAARVLDVIAGYDPEDESTVFGRKPTKSYASFANQHTLAGLRIGVIREYMDKKLFTDADIENIDVVDRGIDDLRRLGATVIDPGPGGALFQGCIDKYVARTRNALFIKQFPKVFATDESGKPTGDQVSLLLDMFFDPKLVPAGVTVRDFGPAPAVGEGKYWMNRYLRERGDQNIKTIDDLIAKANFYTPVKDSRFPDKKEALQNMNKPTTFDMRERVLQMISIQQMVLQCMATLNLDAVTYPTSNIPSVVLGAPVEPAKNGRGVQGTWTLLGSEGFPAITVPAGFTAKVYDRVFDSEAPGGTRLVGPVPAKLPVGIDFLARPFDEVTLIRIASAYEAATKHRTPPPGFGAPRTRFVEKTARVAGK